MNRFEITKIPNSDYDNLTDNITGKQYQIHVTESQTICELLNHLNDRSDKIIEAYTTEALLTLKWQHDIYKRFSKETWNILNKHNIPNLKELEELLNECRKNSEVSKVK